MTANSYDLIVIGEGIAGLAAAQQAARMGFRVATFEAQTFGGLLLNINEMNPAPQDGAASGAEFTSEFMATNAELGVTSNPEPVTGITRAGNGIDVVSDGGRYQARQVLVASGARLKTLGVPGESDFVGRGVSSCADCDGPMFQDQDVVVVGGGDSALQEAAVLTHYCRHVHLVHRGTSYRAQPQLVAAVTGNPKIAPLWNAQVVAIEGSTGVEQVRIRVAGEAVERSLPCMGVFVYIGLAPNSEFLPADVTRDASGAVITNTDLETSLPGVWAAGAVRAGYSGLARDALAEGRRAASGIAARLR